MTTHPASCQPLSTRRYLQALPPPLSGSLAAGTASVPYWANLPAMLQKVWNIQHRQRASNYLQKRLYERMGCKYAGGEDPGKIAQSQPLLEQPLPLHQQPRAINPVELCALRAICALFISTPVPVGTCYRRPLRDPLA